MDTTIRTALIAALGVVASAALSSLATVWVSTNEQRTKIRELESLNKQAQTTLSKTTNLLRYVYDNGSLTSTSATGGKMVVRVNGSRGAGPTVTPIDMPRFIELCADEDGCSMTLGATRFREEKHRDYLIEAPLQGAACRFFWDKPTKSWTLSEQCVVAMNISKKNDSGTAYEPAGIYQTYVYSNAYGHDDSTTEHGDSDGQPLVVLGFKGACYLAESAPDTKRNGGHFMPDNPDDLATGRGLFLIASSPSWDYPGVYPPTWPADDPLRRCDLIVED